MSSDTHFQSFRGRSTLKTANIPTLKDPETGEPIVLWRDIKSAFKDAETIWVGDSLVPLLIDNNTLEP